MNENRTRRVRSSRTVKSSSPVQGRNESNGKKNILAHVILGERRQSSHHRIAVNFCLFLTNATTRSIERVFTSCSFLCSLLHTMVQFLQAPNELLADLRVLLLHG